MPGTLKWLLIVAVLLALLFAGVRLYFELVSNPKVAREILDEPQGERAAKVMLITLPTGREIPVNYLREGNLVFAGADGRWWRPLRDGARVKLVIRGEKLTGHAVVVLDDPDYVEDVFSRLRPTVPEWLPDWLDGKLVVVTLDAD